jgi:hypothetical protein
MGDSSCTSAQYTKILQLVFSFYLSGCGEIKFASCKLKKLKSVQHFWVTHLPLFIHCRGLFQLFKVILRGGGGGEKRRGAIANKFQSYATEYGRMF